MNTNNHIVPISEADRKELEQFLYEMTQKDCRPKKIEENFFQYEVTLQSVHFFTCMTEKELRESARLTVDFLEEFKQIHASGLTRERLQQIEKEVENEGHAPGDVMYIMKIWTHLKTERLQHLIAETDQVRRVGGAWAMLISNPAFISAIYAVYEKLVDQFADEELYYMSAWFLFRAIMRMHSDEVEEEPEH